MEPDFQKANSSLLPRVDGIMVAQYFSCNPDFNSAEFRNVKTSLSTRQSYGDEAIGYVQLKREGNVCIIKCKICPEHKVRSKGYSVTMTVDEKECEVKGVQCHDCAASEGGCKHAVAFLMWVHRRSEEPACTSVECYWRKSNLAKVGTSTRYITTQELTKNRRTKDSLSEPFNECVLKDFVTEARNRKLNCQILKHEPDYQVNNIRRLSLHNLILEFINQCDFDSNMFIQHISSLFTSSMWSAVERETRNQYKTSLWYELRYGRITGSKAFEVSRCKTAEGSLVAVLMGAKLPDTGAMKRGRDLENAVRCEVEKLLKIKIRPSGLYISRTCPIIAASPDGITEDYLVEIKCPTTAHTLNNYIKDGEIGKKYYTQVQIQMFVSGFKRCCFCVADHNFEANKNVNITWVDYDDVYTKDILNVLINIWKVNIFPLLYKSFM